MKNFISSTALILLTFSLFCCNNSNEPLPDYVSGAQDAVAQSASITPVVWKGGNPIPDKQPIPDKFEWKLVETATVPMNKGLNLTSPFAIVNETEGDISWGSDGGCYKAIACRKVSRVILGIVDIKTITPDLLKMLPFVNGQIAWAPGAAPGYTSSWTNYMPVGTVIALKTSLGKFHLVIVKSTSPLVLDIYHEHYYRIY